MTPLSTRVSSAGCPVQGWTPMSVVGSFTSRSVIFTIGGPCASAPPADRSDSTATAASATPARRVFLWLMRASILPEWGDLRSLWGDASRIACARPPGARGERHDRPSGDHGDGRGKGHRYGGGPLEQSRRLETVGCGADEPVAERAECPDLEHQRHGDELPAEQDADRGSARAESRRNPKREHEGQAGYEPEPGRRRDEQACAWHVGRPREHGRRGCRDGEGGSHDRKDQCESGGHAGCEEGEPRAPRNDQLPKDAGAEIARAEGRADEDRCDDTELRQDLHGTREVLEPARRTVLGGVRRVQDQEDRVGDDHGDDSQTEGRKDESAALAELQELGAHEPRSPRGTSESPRKLCGEGCRVHAASSNRDVISRNRCSSDARAGSKRRMARPARTRRRPMSSAAASASTSVRSRTRMPSAAAVADATARCSARRATASSSSLVAMRIACSPPAASSAIEPCMTTRPWSTIATASQIFSTSSRRCEESRTVRPSATKPRIIARNSWIPAGSSPFVGSSRIKSSGSARRLRATPSL